jgi:hypothetical protein
LVIDGLVRPRYRVLPVADHLADRLCAAVGTYARVTEPVGSTRVKDLVDIAIVATSQTVATVDRTVAVRVNAAARRLHLPERFAVPDPVGWGRRYPGIASEGPGLFPDYETAATLAGLLFDPVLGATATGTWDPATRMWVMQ